MKELTILEKAHKVIESGAFAEDFVTCSYEFINGAYAMLEHQKQVKLGLPSVIGRLKSIKRYTESYGEGDFADDGEYVWYEDLEQVIKDFE